jgi:hypothetical protein
MAKILDPALQDYYNGICCSNTTPQGKITLTGGVADGLYTDLASAIAYIQGFTSATITDASLSGDTFKFTVPAGSDFSLSTGFMATTTGNFVDNLGLVTILDANAFQDAQGNNVLGNCTFGSESFQGATGNNTFGNSTFGDNSFKVSSGTNTINNILLTYVNSAFAESYTGTMNILGNIGTTEGNDYPNFFPGASGATINVLASKQTSDGGNVEGDILLAQNNGAQVNFVL